MNDDHNKQESLPDDAQLSDLYRRTRIETPSAVLDQTIRGEARRVARRRRYRWLIPLSSAAIVLLGATLTLKVLELDRPLLESTLPETEEAEAKIESATMPDRTEPDTPASSAPAPAFKPLPVTVTEDAVPRQARERRERPALILDRTATIGTAARIQAPAGQQEAPAPQAESLDGLKHDPAAWLRYIHVLLSQGRTGDATAQLAEFRAGYPNYPLPEDLAGLLTP